eukprot:gene15033-16585_t
MDRAELRNQVFETIRRVGKDKKGSLTFNIDSFLIEWANLHPGQFAKLGFGKLESFLKNDCSAVDIGSRKFRVPKNRNLQVPIRTEPAINIKNDPKEKGEVFRDKLCLDKNLGNVDLNQEDCLSTETRSSTVTASRELIILKAKMLCTIRNIADNIRYIGKNKIEIELNFLRDVWRNSNENEKRKFQNYGFGKFKSFLHHHCNLSISSLEIVLVDKKLLENEIRLLLENHAHSIPEIRQIFGNSENNEMGLSPEVNIINNSASNVNEKSSAKSGNSATQATSPQQNPTKRTSPSVKHKTLSTQQNPDSSSLTSQPSKGPTNEERNFLQLVFLLYKCGLERLREVFMKVHSGWKNLEKDAAQFDMGQLRFDFTNEKQMFMTGDIDHWDITLLVKVLRFSKVAKAKLEKDHGYVGYEHAIKKLKDVKNEIVSHKSSPRLKEGKYMHLLNELKQALGALGLTDDEFDRAVRDADLTPKNLYYQMLIEEVERSNQAIISEVQRESKKIDDKIGLFENKVIDKLDSIYESIAQEKIEQYRIPEQARKANEEAWDTWLEVRRGMGNFDFDANQYILVVDRVISEDDKKYTTALARVPWKLVLDLDPDSDINGFLRSLALDNEESGLIKTHTPSQLASQEHLHTIEIKRIQWMFANGQNEGTEEDRPKSDLKTWSRKFKPAVVKIIESCCSKLDKMKPVYCLIMNVRNESVQMANDIVKEIENMFSYFNFKVSFTFLSSEMDFEYPQDGRFSPLSLKSLYIGIYSILGDTNDQHLLPSYQADAPMPVPKIMYDNLTLYLDILYEGCEHIPKELPEDKLEEFENYHLKSFIVGNPITFESLHFGHDATRTITNRVKQHINKMPARFNSAQIVQICHQPGTGGTTIARRVLWDLHEEFPCAIVKTLSSGNDGFGTESDDTDQFVANLAESIGKINELCELWPVVLMDGNSRLVKNLSDYLVRKLQANGKRAIIVRCVHSKDFPMTNKKLLNSYLHEKSTFEVKTVLDDANRDLKEFRTKYKDYCQRFQQPEDRQKDGEQLKCSSRVYHFPMMAMLGEFDEKLNRIVNQSLEKIKEGKPREYEVAVLVSFLQIYSNRETPAVLIAEYLEMKNLTYEDVANEFSDNLLNLMVSKRAPSRREWIASNKFAAYNFDNDDIDQDDEDSHLRGNEGIGWYTFQHRIIAEKIIAHSKRTLEDITENFVNSNVISSYHKYNSIKQLVNDLFLHNKKNSVSHFSVLITKLENSRRIFEAVAKKTKDASVYAHAARFIAYDKKEPDFKKALKLIEEGLQVDNKASKEKIRRVRDTEGHILFKKMNAIKGKIETVEDLKNLAGEALDRFRKARDNPPMTFPNPLNGEINVWQFCFDWLVKWKGSDVEEAIVFMMSSDFFSSALSDCFFLLDIIDQMVRSLPRMVDPELTMQKANDNRLKLLSLLRNMGKTKRKAIQALNVADFCENIFSKRNFTAASDKELTRLKVSLMMNQAGRGRDIHLLNTAERPKLFGLLERLVKHYKVYDYASYLMDFSTVKGHASYTLDSALDDVREWQKQLPHDAFSHFFSYVICYLQVMHGSITQHLSGYEEAVETCKKRCEGSPRRFVQQYFIRKGGDLDKISKLISRAELEQQYGKGKPGSRGEDTLTPEFWESECRNYLHECKGRIRMDNRNPRRKYPYIALEQGQLRINVPKNAVGDPDWDFKADKRVRFIVCFTLAGPKAYSIKFEDGINNQPVRFGRQFSNLNKNKKGT